MATILIVEERPINRQFLVALLKGGGHRVLEASGGGEALAIARKARPDLALIDILTAGVDGCQFVLDLRAEAGAAPTKIVFRAPAYIETEARALANAFGAAFVAKPASPETLLEVVGAVISGPVSPSLPSSEQKSIDAFLRPVCRKLHRHFTALERLNDQLDASLAERDAQLEVVRAALDQEIKKRLWAEQELTQANVRLRDQAWHDVLTGLYNRRYLEEALVREESRARRSAQPLGIVMIDIDNFKRFNDTLGHAAGDAVLRAIGRHMQSAARSEDIVSRYGGEEFVLVMAQAPRNSVLERAERLRREIQGLEVEHEGLRVGPVTISAGIAMFPDHGESGREVLLVADSALYRAKQSGRNCVVIGEKIGA